ncbi:GntR family transcriptional regulator [Weissella paramesenteroides]|uniref:GntR family transcriptional regulator n=1 Tax=Weissella paramesenteroides TaxID=1249 RepID=UPI001C1F9861|nr:GntR family transcriptional regulator [Weissella paramesenteroides]MBU7556246.1 GntR family transcriptional regulator [Weissella paramesenteroides]
MDTKYDIVKKGLRNDIISGKFAIGDKLPTEANLTEQYNVSRYTVRRATAGLEQEHYLYRIQGDGMYVNDWKKIPAAKTENKVIGVITTHLADYIFPEIISGIDQIISDAGYALFISNTHNTFDRERRSLLRIIETGISGLIIEPTMSALPNPNQDLYDQIKQLHIPTVFINSKYENSDFNYLEVNDVDSEAQLVRHLIAQGHKRILGVFKVDDIQGAHRMQGFYKAFQTQPDYALDSNIIMYQSDDEENNALILNKIESYLELPHRPTALALYNDSLAIQAIDLVKSLGFRIPEDVAIVGFDDYSLSTYMTPSLTTNRHPKRKMGRDAAQILLDLIDGQPGHDVIYEPDIIVRNSSATPLISDDKD